MKRQAKSAVSVLWSLLRFSLLKLVRWKSLTFWPVERFSPNVEVDLVRGELRLGRRVRVHHGTKLLVDRGTLVIGDDAAINARCGLYCFDRIEIGAGCEFGPGVLVYDHDHDFRCPGGLKAGRYRTAPVVIGRNVWVGANTVILKGCVIGDNCVIGAGCIVRGTIPPNTVLTQRRTDEIRPLGGEERSSCACSMS